MRCKIITVEDCLHPTVLGSICCDCGTVLDFDNTEQCDGSNTLGHVSMLHSIPDLKVSRKEAERLGAEDISNLLERRRLVLLVDLDQTLIHTTNDNIPPKLKDVFHFQFIPNGPWYHTRLRPFTKQFLQKVSELYELHICTFGVREYAHSIAKYLDPQKKLFGHRILSRNECLDHMSKKANLFSLFPCGDNLVCIIDDRSDVWNFAPNVVQVLPYHFFRHTGDINAPPGLQKKEADEEKGFDFAHLETSLTENEKSYSESLIDVPDLAFTEVCSENKSKKEMDSGNCKETNTGNDIKIGDHTENKKLLECDKEKIVGTEDGERKSVGESDKNNVDGTEDKKDAIEELNKSVETTIEEKNELVETTTDEKNKSVETTTDEKNKSVETTTDETNKSVESTTEEQNRSVENTTEEQNNSVKHTTEEITNSTKGATEEIKNSVEDTPEEVKILTKDTTKEKYAEMGKETDKKSELKTAEGCEGNAVDIPAKDEFIEVADDDDYLLYLEDILKKLHSRFYKHYDDTPDKLPDLKKLVPSMRAEVLVGVNIAFSSIIPNHVALTSSKAYHVAMSLGANVTENITTKPHRFPTTHVIAANIYTEKSKQAKKLGIKLVNPNWLWCCAERWERVDERLFALEKTNYERNPPLHCLLPKLVESNPSTSSEEKVETNLIENINPLMYFSEFDTKDMKADVDVCLSDDSDNDDEESLETSSHYDESSEDSRPNRKRKRNDEEDTADSEDDELPSVVFRQGDVPSDLSEDSENDEDLNAYGDILEREMMD